MRVYGCHANSDHRRFISRVRDGPVSANWYRSTAVTITGSRNGHRPARCWCMFRTSNSTIGSSVDRNAAVRLRERQSPASVTKSEYAARRDSFSARSTRHIVWVSKRMLWARAGGSAESVRCRYENPERAVYSSGMSSERSSTRPACLVPRKLAIGVVDLDRIAIAEAVGEHYDVCTALVALAGKHNAGKALLENYVA
jgi:hypothetical protein